MLYPSLSVLNFFKDPNEIVKFAKTLKYKPSEGGIWPGMRSEVLHDVHYDLFHSVCSKIMAAFYPLNYWDINFTARTLFQIIPKEHSYGEGWIHKDIEAQITSIVYLSHHANCGTNLYIPESPLKANYVYHPGSKSFAANSVKKDYYLNNKPFDETYLKALKENNSGYKKLASYNSIYNSMVAFDGHNYHSAQGYADEKYPEDRLTMITFFDEITSNKTLKYTGSELLRHDI